jgi:hypothetical protein
MPQEATAQPSYLHMGLPDAPSPPGLSVKNILRLSDYRFQIFSVHMDSGMLVNRFNCQHETHAIALSYKVP